MIRYLLVFAAVTLGMAAQKVSAQAEQTGATTTLPTVVVTATPDGQSLTVPSVQEARQELNTLIGNFTYEG